MSVNPSAAGDRGLPAAGREVFRLATPVVLWWTWVVFAVANAVDLVVQGSPVRSALRIDAIVLLVTGLAYALALRPCVVADCDGITVVNPFRDHYVPWAVIQRVDAGDLVRVHHTRDGSPVSDAEVPGKAIQCWALYVSARAKRREARGAPPRSGGLRGLGQQRVDEMPRLPDEAKRLASLPPAKAIAASLDTRAARERGRSASTDSPQPGARRPVTARWAWFPLATVAAPALALLIMVLALGVLLHEHPGTQPEEDDPHPDLWVPKTYATWADAVRSAGGFRLVYVRRLVGRATGGMIFGLWA